MSETVYQQVEDCIKRKLHLGAPGKSMSMYGMHWHYPVGIEDGDIVMRDSDCGEAKPTWKITVEEWSKRVEERGLWRQVGMWDFVRADALAASCIAFCHKSPYAAGQQLYELRKRVDKETEEG